MKKLMPTEDERSAFVKITSKIKFFASMNMGLLEKILFYVALYEFDKGEKVCRQGEKGDAFYAVMEGELSVSVKSGFFSSKKVATLKAGDFFGEMALIDHAPRSATVTCETHTKIFLLLTEHFDAALRENPKFADEIRKLAGERQFEIDHK